VVEPAMDFSPLLWFWWVFSEGLYIGSMGMAGAIALTLTQHKDLTMRWSERRTVPGDI